MTLYSIRRENLTYIINSHGTQTKLAEVLTHETLSQPTLSRIECGKRALHDKEARYIEQKIGIPEYWIDKYPLKKVWRLLMKFRKMSHADQETVNDLLNFAETQRTNEP